jgi:hypothetical protein
LRKTATKITHKIGTQQSTTRLTTCKRLDLHPPKHSLIELERKWWRKMPHHWRRPSSPLSINRLLHNASRPSSRGPLPSHIGSTGNGALTLDLEMQQDHQRGESEHALHREQATPKATVTAQAPHHDDCMCEREVRGRERCHVSFMNRYQLAKSMWKHRSVLSRR